MEKLSDHEKVIRSLEQNSSKSGVPHKLFAMLVVLVIVLGLGLGFAFSKLTNKSTTSATKTSGDGSNEVVGIADKKTFKDQAEGTLKEGGMEGEGSFHLQRPGGISQNVYLTSSTVDLSQYLNKKVRVWGETFSSEKAGWLMDVGLVEVLN